LRAVATAPAKVILAGEHFVVMGKPAIAMAVNLYSRVKVSRIEDSTIHVKSTSLKASGSFQSGKYVPDTGTVDAAKALEPIQVMVSHMTKRAGLRVQGLDIEIDSNMPLAAGLGSSASVAVSLIAALSKLLGMKTSREEIRELAFIPERIVHGKPSGIDQTTATYGGVITFSLEKGFEPVTTRYDVPIVIGNTGIPRSTGEQVMKVRSISLEHPNEFNLVAARAAEISREAREAIKKGELNRLGELMNDNHELLRSLDLSNTKLEELITAARSSGALGAKLTGAGGGGCMIAVVAPGTEDRVAEAIARSGGEPFTVKTDREGVKAWLE
jgi:mevalonate kinase